MDDKRAFCILNSVIDDAVIHKSKPLGYLDNRLSHLTTSCLEFSFPYVAVSHASPSAKAHSMGRLDAAAAARFMSRPFIALSALQRYKVRIDEDAAVQRVPVDPNIRVEAA